MKCDNGTMRSTAQASTSYCHYYEYGNQAKLSVPTCG